MSEIVQYYRSQGYVNAKAINSALSSLDAMEILTGDSDFSNLLTFSSSIFDVLGMR